MDAARHLEQSPRLARRARPLQRALRTWALLALLCVASFAVALGSGTSDGGVPALLDALRLLVAPDGSTAAAILHGLRLPRALAAFGVGGLLAVAGALMQVLLRNPLADPYVLGVSGGAAGAALLALMLGAGAALAQAGAFAGALLTIAAVYAIAHRDLSRLSAPGTLDATPRLLLSGVMLASAWAAVITLLLALAPEAQLRGMVFWLTGDLAGSDAGAWPVLALALLLAVAWPLARSLNVMLRGAAMAQSLGVRVVAVRRTVFVLASLAAAVAVAGAGNVGFVGLVVPHALRLVIGNDQRVLLPACALAGGSLLLLADTLARTVVAPQQLPVGVVTTLLGVPTFLWLLLRRGAPR
jgi:iron complex transport system permease protein